MFEEFPDVLGIPPKYLGIVGSRNFANFELIEKAIEVFPVGTPIVTGDAKGVDTMAYHSGKKLGNTPIRVHACWQAHGKGAGLRRNPVIVDIAWAVLAFWDGESTGTLNSMKHAFNNRKPCIVVYDDPDGRWELIDREFARKYGWRY